MTEEKKVPLSPERAETAFSRMSKEDRFKTIMAVFDVFIRHNCPDLLTDNSWAHLKDYHSMYSSYCAVYMAKEQVAIAEAQKLLAQSNKRR